jgi:hypothetical protein
MTNFAEWWQSNSRMITVALSVDRGFLEMDHSHKGIALREYRSSEHFACTGKVIFPELRFTNKKLFVPIKWQMLCHYSFGRI